MRQSFQRRHHSGCTRIFVDDVKHIYDRLAACLRLRPPGQSLGHRIEQTDPRLGIGCDHRITNGTQSDAQFFFA